MRSPRTTWIALFTAITLLAGCAGKGADNTPASAPDAQAAPLPADGARSGDTGEAASPMEEGAALESGAQLEDPSRPDAKVIRTGKADVRVADPKAGAQELRAKVAEFGGQVVGAEISAYNNQTTAVLTVKVPHDKFDALVDYLGDIGTVEATTISTDDVTLAYKDTEARIAALETSVSRLTELMKNATSTEALLEAEQTLTSRQSELDGLKAQLKHLDSQVEMSSLTVDFRSGFKPQTYDDNSFGAALREGWQNLLASFKFLARVLPVILPWGLGIFLILFLAVRLCRARIKRRARGALPKASAKQPPNPQPPAPNLPPSQG